MTFTATSTFSYYPLIKNLSTTFYSFRDIRNSPENEREMLKENHIKEIRAWLFLNQSLSPSILLILFLQNFNDINSFLDNQMKLKRGKNTWSGELSYKPF